MQTSWSGRSRALLATALLLTLISAGCGRGTQPANVGGAAAPQATALDAGTPVVTEMPTGSVTTVPAATDVPAATATPVPTPDLAAIDRLLKDIDNDLNADASAGADEGTTP